MPEMLPRSAEMSVRSLVQAFGKVARGKVAHPSAVCFTAAVARPRFPQGTR
jgi:hypothetical protein